MLPRELLPALLVFGACVPMGSVGPLPAEDARVDPGHPDANTAADAGPGRRLAKRLKVGWDDLAHQA